MDKEFVKTLRVSFSDDAASEKVIKALSCRARRDILRLLESGPRGIWEIAETLNTPVSTVSEHISVLLKAGIISVIKRVSDRGYAKIVSRQYEKIEISIGAEENENSASRNFTMQIPIGSYTAFRAGRYCGMLAEDGYIGGRDNPDIFYSPLRFAAQLIWFDCGWLEYTVPLPDDVVKKAASCCFCTEICSESPVYNEDWKSDIFFEINGVRIGVWTSPGDFGRRHGVYTPEWWSGGTSYGLMVKAEVNDDGAFINGEKVSDVNVERIGLNKSGTLTFRLGVDENAKNKGGLNIFGKKFGDYDRHIVLSIAKRG